MLDHSNKDIPSKGSKRFSPPILRKSSIPFNGECSDTINFQKILPNSLIDKGSETMNVIISNTPSSLHPLGHLLELGLLYQLIPNSVS